MPRITLIALRQQLHAAFVELEPLCVASCIESERERLESRFQVIREAWLSSNETDSMTSLQSTWMTLLKLSYVDNQAVSSIARASLELFDSADFFEILRRESEEAGRGPGIKKVVSDCYRTYSLLGELKVPEYIQATQTISIVSALKPNTEITGEFTFLPDSRVLLLMLRHEGAAQIRQLCRSMDRAGLPLLEANHFSGLDDTQLKRQSSVAINESIILIRSVILLLGALKEAREQISKTSYAGPALLVHIDKLEGCLQQDFMPIIPVQSTVMRLQLIAALRERQAIFGAASLNLFSQVLAMGINELQSGVLLDPDRSPLVFFLPGPESLNHPVHQGLANASPAA